MSWDKVLYKHQQQVRYCCVFLFGERTSWSSIMLPLRGMRLSLQSIVSKKIILILQTQHFFKVMSPWTTMVALQPKAQEGPQSLLLCGYPGTTGYGGGWGMVRAPFPDSFLQTFPFWYFHRLLSCQSQGTCYPFVPATTCFLFVLIFDRRCTAVGTCPEEAWRALWKPTNFSENLTPSSKTNATVIISRRWHCYQSGLSFPATKPTDLKVPSSSLQKEVVLILFSNKNFC